MILKEKATLTSLFLSYNGGVIFDVNIFDKWIVTTELL